MVWLYGVKRKIEPVLVLGGELDNLLRGPGSNVEANWRIVVIAGVQAYGCYGIEEANECDAHLAPQVRFQKDVHEMSRSCSTPAKTENIHRHRAGGEAGDHGADLGQAFL